MKVNIILPPYIKQNEILQYNWLDVIKFQSYYINSWSKCNGLQYSRDSYISATLFKPPFLPSNVAHVVKSL